MFFDSEDYMKTFNNAKSGDLSFNEKGNFCDSERFYKEVIYNYEKKLVNQPKCIGTLCDWIASYHELSLIYQQQGAVTSAQQCLLIPHQSMLYMAKNNNGDEEQEIIAVNAIGLTLPPLMAFAEEYPTCEKCMKELKSQLSWVEKNKKKHH